MIKKISVMVMSSVILLSACSSEDSAKKEEQIKATEQKVAEQEKELTQKAAKMQSPEEMIKPYFNSLMDGDIDTLKKVVIDEQQEDATQVFEQIKSQLSAQGIKVKVKDIISSKEQDGFAVVFYILEYVQQDKTTGYEINQLPFKKVGETWSIVMNPTLLPEEQSKVFDELLIAQQTAFQNDKAMQEHLEWVQEQNQAFMEQMQRDQDTANQMHQDAVNQHNQMQQQQMQQQMTPPAMP